MHRLFHQKHALRTDATTPKRHPSPQPVSPGQETKRHYQMTSSHNTHLDTNHHCVKNVVLLIKFKQQEHAYPSPNVRLKATRLQRIS